MGMGPNPQFLQDQRQNPFRLDRLGERAVENTSGQVQEPSNEDFEPTVLDTGVGGRFSSLEGHLVSGIEGMLPTPAIRYRVSHQRLAQEIETLKSQLQCFQGLPQNSSLMKRRLALLESRLEILTRHSAQIEALLYQLHDEAGGGWLFRFFTGWQHCFQGLTGFLGQGKGMGQFAGRSQAIQELEQKNRQLQALCSLLEKEGSTSQMLSATEEKELLVAYERLLCQVDTLSQTVTQQKSLWQSWNEVLTGWFRRFYL